MFSFELLAWCVVIGGVYLALITVVLELVGKMLKVSRGIPPTLMETTGASWHIMNFVMEFLFFVVIPALGYSMFYIILPLSGIRPGLAAALLAFTLGALPALLGLSVRIKLPMAYLLWYLFSLLVKIGGTLGLIGYLYTL